MAAQTASDLYREGKLGPAIQALGVEVRDNPTDQKRRTFLFELLCFAGEYERAEKHLEVLASAGMNFATGGLLYRAAIAAERSRNDLFAKKEYPSTASDPVRGTLNGKPFESLEDADPRIGPRLEIFTAGQYMWLPLSHLASVQMEAPKRLRDLLWAPCLVRTGPQLRALELGEVLVPALSPFSFRHPDDAVRLGRVTVWEEEGETEIPFGQKTLLVDGEEFPLLELRRLEIAAVEEAPQSHATTQ
jgi:type VI secretion system protein ImpE